MPTLLDVFKSDAFTTTSMTAAVNKLPFVPGRVGALGIFNEIPIMTTTFEVEEMSGTLSLIPNKQRGDAPHQNKHGKRTVRLFKTNHLPVEDAVWARECQDVRAFGGTELQGIEQLRNMRMLDMTKKHDATLEYGRLGAVKGVIYDADGSTAIYDLFTEFGLSQTESDLVLGTTTTDVVGKITDIAGAIEDELGAAVYDHVHVLYSPSLWKKFISHTAVKDAYKYFQRTGNNTNPLSNDMRYKGFVFGDMIHEQYRGKVGGVDFIADGYAHAFPVGVPDLFQTAYAPGDFMEAVNTPGLPRYAKAELMKYDRGINILTESNPLSICTRPKVLVKIHSSN